MQVIYKRASVLAGFSLLALVLLLNAWMTKRQLESQIRDHGRLIHTQKVLQELTETELLLDDAETGQRGYLYTGKPEYLEPYTRATKEIDDHLREVARLTAADPSQLERASNLTALAHKKLAELGGTLSLYESGKAADTKALVLSGRGKSTMDEIRRVALEMEREENEQEDTRTAEYARSVWRTRASLLLATVLAIVGAALLAHYILRQMDLRERHASQMREREEWYRVTLTCIGDAVIATDPEGMVTFLNPIAEQLTGREFSMAKGRPIHEVFPIFNEFTREVVANPVTKVMALGAVIGLANHTVLEHKDGTLIPIEDSAAPIRDDRENLIGVVLVFRDATRDRKAQEIVRKAEKLAAAARLASTVAHEINNPLDAAGNLVYLAKLDSATPPTAVTYLEQAETQLERVAHIARQTLGFYRESRKWESVDIIGVFESALSLYSNKLNAKSIRVERDFGVCPHLYGSLGELKQVAANLISNAADAVRVDGRIRVTIGTVSASGAECIEFAIEDDGPGVAAEDRERIFEPFFTTKEDVGTGLGLWVTKGIVERHGGTIRVGSSRSNGLRGATFVVSLPIIAASAASLPAEPVLAASDVCREQSFGGVAGIDD
jgi:PAS domain S-box-containing protein